MINVLADIIDLFFGDCRHKHYTFPITVRRAADESGIRPRAATYVVCLDCAKQFPYDWEHMKVVWEPQATEAQVPDGVPEIRVDRLALDACFSYWYGLRRIVRYRLLRRWRQATNWAGGNIYLRYRKFRSPLREN